MGWRALLNYASADCPNLSLFWGSRYDVLLDHLSCLSFRDPAKVMRYHGRYCTPRDSIDHADDNLTHLETSDNPNAQLTRHAE